MRTTDPTDVARNYVCELSSTQLISAHRYETTSINAERLLPASPAMSNHSFGNFEVTQKVNLLRGAIWLSQLRHLGSLVRIKL